jgi:hypothetical protein
MAASKNPRPTCQSTNPVEIDPGTQIRNRSPSPGPVCGPPIAPYRAPIQVDTLVLDEDQITSFLESVAHAKVAEHHIKLVWKDYKESTVINIIYSILPLYGKPGSVEVEPGDIHKILAQTQIESQKLQEQFLRAASRGAKSVIQFLKAQEEIRRLCLDTIQSLFREASQINEEIQNETRKAIARLSLIKASFSIILKGAGLVPGGGLPAFVIGTGYDVSLKLITDWEKAQDAKLVGITSTLVQEAAKEGIEEAAEYMNKILKAEESTPANKSTWLRKRVEQMESELQKQASAERLKKFARDSRRLARAEQEAARARWGARAYSSVKFIFFAWDVYSIAEDADATFKSAGYDSSVNAIHDAFK